MRHIRALSLVAAALVSLCGLRGNALAQDTATAGSGRGALGVGYAQSLRNVGGVNVVYDPGPWHADAILGLAGNGTTVINFAVRGWYHLHMTGASDFSLGGGLALQNTNPDGAAESTNALFVDLGGMLRFFVVPNVSVSLFAGLSVGAADADGFLISAQPLSQLGVAYFF
jgi:hypothetical protein